MKIINYEIKKHFNKLFSLILISILLFPIIINSLSLKLKSTVKTNTSTNTNAKTNTNTNLKSATSSSTSTNTNTKTSTKTNTNTEKFFNRNRNTFNTNLSIQLQKTFLSTENFQIMQIIPKKHKISTEGIFFDEKNSDIYEAGVMKNTNILLKKNYPSNKVSKALPLVGYNVSGIAKCGQNILHQFSGIKNKILRFSYPNLEILPTISIDFAMKNGKGLAELSEDFLIASNGTNIIYVLDCKNELNVIKLLYVRGLHNEPLSGINDMTVVGEFIYATKENDNRIFKINPADGKVVKFYNMMNLINYELKTKSLNSMEIRGGKANLSGISYDKKKKLFIITGKNWGHYYEVDLK